MVSKRLIILNLIPIDSMRNYAILHIVADEAKIFQTKERAPVLLHFEAFRPEELMLEVGPERTLSQAIDSSKKEKAKKGK
jgi:predicted choloylglycine hydrolase